MTLEQCKQTISDEPAILIYFSGVGCGVCTALQPKIKKAFEENYPKIKQYYFDIEEYKEIAINFNVFSMPTVLVFLDGKEFVRKSRNMSVDGIINDLQRPYNLFIE